MKKKSLEQNLHGRWQNRIKLIPIKIATRKEGDRDLIALQSYFKSKENMTKVLVKLNGRFPTPLSSPFD